MSRPVPNTTFGGFLPNQVKINSIGIGIDDNTLNALNLNTTQYMVVGGQTNDIYNLIVDSEGVIVNSSLVNRAAYSNEYALFVDGNIYVSGKVDTAAGTLSNIAGGGGGNTCNYWFPVINDLPSSTNIYYDGKINIANQSAARSNAYRVNIVDDANKNILHSQLAIQNQVGSIGRLGILGYSNLSPVIVNSAKGPLEFHANRDYDYFSNVYHKSTIINGNSDYGPIDLPFYTSTSNAPHMVINTDGTIGIKVAPNPPVTYTLRTVDANNTSLIVPTTITNKPVDLHIAGTTYSCNILMFDYESKGIQNLDDLYVRKLGVTFAASQVMPGTFAPGDFTFQSNLSIGGPIEPGCNLTVYGKAHITELLYADKSFLSSNLTIQNTLIVNGTSYFENDVTMNNNLQVNENVVIWGGLYADSNSIKTIVPAGSNSNAVVDVQFINYIANGWSNIYMQGAGFITPGKVGIGINNQYDTVPSQLTIISRDSDIYGLSIYDKTNVNVTKALFIGHQRSNIINGQVDASVIFSTPSSTSPYFTYVNNAYPQNMYFYPGKYDKSLVTSNMVADGQPPVFSIYETGQVAVNSFEPDPLVQFYIKGSIGFTSNLYNYNESSDTFDKIALFKYGNTIGSTTNYGISYIDTNAAHVGINTYANDNYGLSINGGIYSDIYYTNDNHKGVLWIDSTTANSDTTATSVDGIYVLSKVGVGVNEPDYLIDIAGNNAGIGNQYGTYMRMNCSILDASLSNTGIRFDGITQPWFMNVEKVNSSITRYAVGSSPDISRFVDTYSIAVPVYWNSNYNNVNDVNSNISPPNISYGIPIISSSNLSVGLSNIINTSNIHNTYNITFLSNVVSNITSNINNISGFPSVSYNITYNVDDLIIFSSLSNVTTTSNYNTPLYPTLSNIVYTSNYIYTSNITYTSSIYNAINTSNYIYSSNNNGLLIQYDLSRGIFGHQVVIGGNASLLNKTYLNPNPNPYATLTVNGDTSIIGNLNVTGRITANNTVSAVSSERSNVPSIQNDDLFISGKDIYFNPTNKLYINYTAGLLTYPVEQQTKAVLNVYQDIVNSSTPAPIAHFVGKGDYAYIEIFSKAIQDAGDLDNDGILRIGLVTGDANRQIIGFQDGTGNNYMTFRKKGNTQRAMGINTDAADAQLHIVNDFNSMNQNMFRLTYNNGANGDTNLYTPNIIFEKNLNNSAVNKKWIIQGPTYGTELYNQLSFTYIDDITDNYSNRTITSNTVLSITSNGYIGINTTSPGYMLDIVSSNVGPSVNQGIRLWNKINTDIAQLVFQSGSSPIVGGDIQSDYVMYSCNNEFTFQQRNNLAISKPLFHFNSNTKLGINSYARSNYNVQIGGKLNVTDALYVNDVLVFEASNTTGFSVNGSPNIYLRPITDYPGYIGGVVINGNFPTSNLFHIFNDNTGSANMTVYDSVLNKTEVYYRNFDGGIYNTYQLYTLGNEFGIAYHEMATRDTNLPSTGWSNAFYIDLVNGTNYKEYDMTVNGNITLHSDIRGIPNISFGTNGMIGGNNSEGSLFIMPGSGSNLGIGTTQPRKTLDVIGDIITTTNIGIGTTLPASALHVEGVIQCSTGDADKIQFTEYANASKIAHTAGWGVGIYAGIDNANTGFISFNNATTSGFVERMRIDTNGNLGIGTISPQKALDVRGDIITTTNIGIGTTLPTAPLTVYGNAEIGSGLFGSSISTAGGPFFKQASWDSANGTHTITYPSYCVGDNSSGMIFIQISNKVSNSSTAKLGNIQASFIKTYTTDVSVLEIVLHKNTNLSTLSISNNANNIIVQTDSDCSISWTSIGSY